MTEHPFSLTHAEISKLLGIADRTAVGRAIALLQEPAEIQHLLEAGTLAETQLRYLSRIKDPVQRISLAQQAAKEGWSTREMQAKLGELPPATPKVPAKPRQRVFGIHWAKESASIRCRDFNFKTETVDDYLAEFSRLLRERVEARNTVSPSS